MNAAMVVLAALLAQPAPITRDQVLEANRIIGVFNDCLERYAPKVISAPADQRVDRLLDSCAKERDTAIHSSALQAVINASPGQDPLAEQARDQAQAALDRVSRP